MADAGIASDDIFNFANPRQAIVMRGLLSPVFNRVYTIIGTPAIADKTIVGVAPSAIVSGFLGDPEIEFSTQGTIHMEGASPLDITTDAVQIIILPHWIDAICCSIAPLLKLAPPTGPLQHISRYLGTTDHLVGGGKQCGRDGEAKSSSFS